MSLLSLQMEHSKSSSIFNLIINLKAWTTTVQTEIDKLYIVILLYILEDQETKYNIDQESYQYINIILVYYSPLPPKTWGALASLRFFPQITNSLGFMLHTKHEAIKEDISFTIQSLEQFGRFYWECWISFIADRSSYEHGNAL